MEENVAIFVDFGMIANVFLATIFSVSFNYLDYKHALSIAISHRHLIALFKYFKHKKVKTTLSGFMVLKVKWYHLC